MAIIIVTATKNATTKGRDYPAVILGDIKKRKGRLCLHPITHRSSHADPSFRPRREPSSRSGFSLFIRRSSKQPANLEAGRGVGTRFGCCGYAPRPSSILISPVIALCVTEILRNFSIFRKNRKKYVTTSAPDGQYI